jgi:hypothetical protein
MIMGWLVIENLDWLALALGTVGSFLWAQNGAWAKYSTLWWLASSLLWIVVSYIKGLPAVGARDMIGVALNLYGMWRWFGRPATAVAVATKPADKTTPVASHQATRIMGDGQIAA